VAYFPLFHGLGFAADEEPFEGVGILPVTRGDRVMVLVRPHARIPPVRGTDIVGDVLRALVRREFLGDEFDALRRERFQMQPLRFHT